MALTIFVVALSVACAEVGSEPTTNLAQTPPDTELPVDPAATVEDDSGVTTYPGIDPSALERHIAFREMFDFLSTDPEHISGVITAGGHSDALSTLGIELTATEWFEMQRRMAILERVSQVKSLVTGLALVAEGVTPTGPLYAGVWQDHLDGGRLKLAVTDAQEIDIEALRALFDDPDDILVIEQQYSLDQLFTFRSLIEERVQRDSVPSALSFDHSDSGVRILLSLYPDAHAVDVAALTEGIPEGIVVVEYLTTSGELLYGG